MAGRRIVLATGGSLGDIHPVIAMGLALQRLGLKAEVATSLDHRAKIEAEGLGFHEVGPSLARLKADTGLDLAGLTDRIARSNRFLFQDIMLAYAAEAARQMIGAAEGADAVVGLSFAPGARMAAERLGLPLVSVSLQPTTVFSAYDPPFLPHAPWLRPSRGGVQLGLNRATLAMARATTAGWTRRLDRIRHDLGLGPAPGDVFFDALRHADLALGLYSPLLSPRQPDAPANFHVTGYAAYDSEAGGPAALDPALARFLAEGPPPVVFTLGSAAVNIAGDFYRQGLRSARALGRRAVLLVGPDGDPGVADGPDAIAVAYAPYSLLFPHAAAIAHQGGVGTTQQALRAGRPQVIAPHLGDQYDNARRIVRLKLGETVARSRLDTRLTPALDRVLADPALAERARALGQAAALEDGAAEAARLIADLMRGRGRQGGVAGP